MICAHMIQKCNIPPADAVESESYWSKFTKNESDFNSLSPFIIFVLGFEKARGHKMERENYVESLKRMIAKMDVNEDNCETICHDGNLRTISTQTGTGTWLNKVQPESKRRRLSPVDSEKIKNIRGTVLVNGTDLISDGCGGHYIRVDLEDIRPLRSDSHKNSGNIDYNESQSSGQHRHPSRGALIGCDYDESESSQRQPCPPKPSDKYYSNNNWNLPQYSRNRFVGNYGERNDRFDRRPAGGNDRRNGQSYREHREQREKKYFNDSASSDLFKY